MSRPKESGFYWVESTDEGFVVEVNQSNKYKDITTVLVPGDKQGYFIDDFEKNYEIVRWLNKCIKHKKDQNMTKDDQIKQNIEKSKQLYRKRKQKASERKQELKEAAVLLRKERIPTYKVELRNGFILTIGIVNQTKDTQTYICAACSPRDTYSKKIAKGLLGERYKKSLFHVTERNSHIYSDLSCILMDIWLKLAKKDKEITIFSMKLLKRMKTSKEFMDAIITRIG